MRISWSIGSEKSFGHEPPVGVKPSTSCVQGEHPIHILFSVYRQGNLNLKYRENMELQAITKCILTIRFPYGRLAAMLLATSLNLFEIRFRYSSSDLLMSVGKMCNPHLHPRWKTRIGILRIAEKYIWQQNKCRKSIEVIRYRA